MFVIFPLGIIIVLFNQPKFLVAPACREQEDFWPRVDVVETRHLTDVDYAG